MPENHTQSAQTQQLRELAAAERERRGWTQEEAAEKVGMSLRAYGLFELGKSNPQARNLRAIRSVYGLDAGQDDVAQAEQSEGVWGDWPNEVTVFLLMMGAYVMAMPEGERMPWMLEETRRIARSRNGG